MAKNAKILIVDDTKEIRLLLKILLEDDFQIFEADSGESCLQQVEIIAPDVILLDVNMTGITGYEVCQHLRKKSSTQNISVIILSALDTVEQRKIGFDSGCDDYIIKPVDPNELYTKIENCLQNASKDRKQ